MAKCEHCQLDMLTSVGCSRRKVEILGVEYLRVKYSIDKKDGDGWAADDKKRCHDCGCLPGHYHHYGCDVERCPRCGGQMISCPCGEEGE